MTIISQVIKRINSRVSVGYRVQENLFLNAHTRNKIVSRAFKQSHDATATRTSRNKRYFKNRRTAARTKHIRNLSETLTGYIKLNLSSFWLSDYNLRWIKMEKMTTTSKYKNKWDYKKKILKWKNMRVNKLIVLF